MASYLITDSSRGLGLSMAAALASKPATEVAKIFATGLDKTDSLQKLVDNSACRVESVQLDITSKKSVQHAVRQVSHSLKGKGLDVLINSAGEGSSCNGSILDS
ncbi:Short-chain dehydrogenase/reductase SDR [Macrophomina phaseolina MS6]|uniref:Short-chain dehydrogenase/reductase SDR n=1 Tax=Macrophomina phaseolina (strain MS6) TaxID=1126212 RepID=K2RLA5_MACPH|nr:Short-chain dehydrogenase/reductase SDR [Macrophomina phaseolina MS6]